MTGNELRKLFLDYFQKHQHQIVRSSSLVPADDPTLLFTNAGMVQFKRIFLGEEKRDYVRAATSQKCVRAGGKHNDLENVGYTARHHTFFEMLGNFSFGDYFKQNAIDFAWDLLVNGYQLPKEKLWVSVYLDDDEAYDLWHRQAGVSADRITRLGEKDNFWSMGDTGPCGPCSEIHIDRGEQYGCGRPDCRVGCDCDRFLEIWNLVFMQFNRDANGTLTPLPKPSIDTGMGLERIASVTQHTATNYETDLILPIIRKTEALSERSYGESASSDVAMKVIADHSRAAAFLIGDGVLPSNDGRGYVLRRILRRAIRYGRHIGLTKPFLHETAGEVIHIMKAAYPELADAAAFISNVLRNEEIRFSETLDNGLRLLNDTIEDLKARGEKTIPGQVIFKLYDTFGFPVDIVRDVIRNEDFQIDQAGFDAAMAGQRAQSRSVTTFSKTGEAYKRLSAEGFSPEFVGYRQQEAVSEIVLLVQNGEEITEAVEGNDLEVVSRITPFYGASGGQVGDTGIISAPGAVLSVTDTVKDPTGLILHKATVTSGRIKKGDSIRLKVDNSVRGDTARNHTATHILHAVLREVLGDHVKQAGSLVAPDRLRFDFTHFSPIEPETLDAIESLVNERIRQNAPVHTVEMGAEEAMKSGATALFEEKYGDRVRVVSLSEFSRELCGGTHTEHTGDIGLFKILGESSVASGVRRMEAVTGAAAVAYVQASENILRAASRSLKDKPENLTSRIEKLLSRQKELEKEITQLKADIAGRDVEDVSEDFITVEDIKVVAKKVAVDNPAALRDLADKFKDKIQSGLVVLGSVAEDKVLLVAVVTKDMAGKLHAGKIIKEVAAVVGGGGGGRPDMAQAGGTKPEKLDDALAIVGELVKNR
ncbi:MAG: alanine--tRNA ligase [Desulfobacterales bacterium]|jgi:alanyl-tRNA synthetase|nr:alanine--tRNA ligase [Desulfobacterales bacterium]